MKIAITRIEVSPYGTFGAMTIDGRAFCVTLERPDLGNQPQVSCIPIGDYECRRKKSPKFGYTFEVMSVPGRGDILFHAGNYVKDSLGCILLGASFENTFSGERMIANSSATFKKFMLQMILVDTFWLSIARHDAGCV